jgi:hypothetical protein
VRNLDAGLGATVGGVMLEILFILAVIIFVCYLRYEWKRYCERAEVEQRQRREREYIMWHEEQRQKNQEYMLSELYRKTGAEIDRITKDS